MQARVNIYARQVSIFESANAPLKHLTVCHDGRCPEGEQICCYECEQKRSCSGSCDDDGCRFERIRERIYKR